MSTKAPVVTIMPQQYMQGPVASAINQIPIPTLVQPLVSGASNWYGELFTQSNILLMVCFLILYFLIFGLMKLLLGERFSYATASLIIDCFSVIIMIISITSYYTNSSNTITVYDPLGNLLIWLRNFFDTPSNLLLLTMLMILMYLMLYILHVPPGEFKPYSVRILEMFMWSFFTIDIFAVLFLFLFGFSITDIILNPMINGWYSLAVGNILNPTTLAPSSTASNTPNPNPLNPANPANSVVNVDGSITYIVPNQSPGGIVNNNYCQPSPTPTPPGCTDQTLPLIVRDSSGNIVNNMKALRSEICVNVAKQVETPKATNPPPTNQEVFNVSNNLYTYDDAQSVCKSYGARLATYDEIEASYTDGGEWCNYGWSANQMALFPTQKDTWNRLQATKNHKHDCGRPGINGGYIDNPDIQFGANCYGTKPTAGPDIVAAEPSTKFPEEEEDERKMRELQGKKYQINNFNRQKWSEYQR